MKLYRPVGEKEYQLIKQSGFTEFPPRLPKQPSTIIKTLIHTGDQIRKSNKEN